MTELLRPRPAGRMAVGPAHAPAWLRDAVIAGGASVVEPADAEALLWADPDDPAGLADLLADHGPQLAWVQLPWAGVEPYLDILDRDRIWTCGKGVYAEPVAELALTLTLAGLRGIAGYLRTAPWSDRGLIGTNLQGADVVVLGGGGIAESFVRLVAPFDTHLTVVRRRDDPFPGAQRTIGLDQLDDVLATADVVVLALALTPDTTGLFDAERLARMQDHAWLVNVARGAHVVTDDLVEVLRAGGLGGAALDVTDPEPLPAGHPLWTLDNCILTPHVGNTPAMARPLLSERITTNVRRWLQGDELIGLVDVDAGY